MKKVFTLFITVLYITVSTGLAVEIHHCMGEIKDFSFSTSGNNKCASCGMQKGSNNCCKDELKFVKLQDAYKLSSVNYTLTVPEAKLHDNYILFNKKIASSVAIVHGNSHAPPGSPSSSLSILNCVFRI